MLVTGGCGFLGQHLLREIVDEFPFIKIKVLDIETNHNAFFDVNNHPRIEFCLGKNICVFDTIKDDFKDIDVVIHLAGLVSFSLKDKDQLKMVNVYGIQNVLRAVSNYKTKLFVNVSSVAALGFNDNRNDPINEHFVFNWKIAQARKKHYMLSKHKADKEVNKARSDGLQAIILYPGLMFGPGDVSNMGKLIKEIKKRGLPFLMPGGTNVVDVRDVAKGIIAALKQGKPQENYLLSGINLSYKQIFTIITKETGTKSPKLAIPKSFNTLLYYVILLMESLSNKKISLMADNIDSSFKFRYYDNSKAKRELGWEPRIPFEETIKDSVKWMESHDLFES